MPQRQERLGSKSKRSSYDGYLHEKDGQIVMRVVTCISIGLFFLVPVNLIFIYISIGLLLGALGGYTITPDSDHMGTTHEEYRAIRKFKFFGSLLVAWMVPYAYLFRHRGRGSHSIFPGTPIRFLWYTWPLLVMTIVFAIYAGPLNSIWYPAMLVGWSIQDMVHYRRDGLGWLGLKNRRIPRKA